MEEEEAASRRQALLAQIERKRRELAELERCFLASEPHAQPSAATSTPEVADSVQSSTSVVVVATPSTTKGLGATAEERDEEADVYAEHTYEPMVHRSLVAPPLQQQQPQQKPKSLNNVTTTQPQVHVAESDSSATEEEEEGGYEICPSSFSSFSSSVSASSPSASSFSSSSSSAKLLLFGSNNATNAVTQKQPMHALDESAAEEETENNVSYEVYPSFDHERDDAFKAATTPKTSFALLQADSEVDGYEEVVQVDHQKTTIRASSSSSSYSYSSASTSCSETTTRVRKDSTSSSSPNSTTKERRRKRRTRRKYSNTNKKEEQGATSTLFPYNSATSKSRRDRGKRARRWQALHAMNRNDTRQLDGLDNSLWNKHFQAMLALEDNEDKYSKLAYLAHDMSSFAFLSHAAEVYGRIIISERFLPYDDKTIKPLSMGGVAGGEKYQCRGMLFKFAVDTEYKSGCWMYGFCHPNDTNAMKAAAHELRSLARIVDAEAAAEGIFVPLMTIVDYRGFRLTAVSILPISHKTICYGSHDAGRTVHADYEVFNECLSSIFQRLNLKPHIVKNVTLYACGDIEGHWGADGRFYLVDFSRVYCPESTEVASAYFPVAEPRSVFFKMLRPELVVCNKVPLSSDAYSGWQAKDPNWRTHNDEVTEATRNLVDVIIPNFVQDVRKMCQSDKERFKGTYRRYCAECRSIFGGDTPNTPTSRAASLSRPTFTSRHAEVLKDATSVEMLNRQINNVLHQMHTHGINRRYLGLVRHHLLKEPHSSGCMWKYSSLLFTEMAARVCKNIIRALLREKMKALKVPSSEPYRQLVLQLFNLFSGHSTYSHHFWTSNTPPDFPRDVEGAEKKQAQNKEEGEDEEKAESEDEKLKGGLEYYIWVAVQEKERRERNEKVNEDVLMEKRNRSDLDSSYDRLLKTNLRWLLPLKCCIRAKFGNIAFTKEELRCKDRTRPFLFQGLFFRRLCSMLGITVADVPAIYDALNGSPPAAVPHPYEWLDPHLLDLEAKVKHMHLIAGSEGQALWLKAQKLADKSRSRGDYDLDPTTRGKVKRLLNFAKEKLLLALSSIPDSVPTLLLLGKVSHKLVMLCEEEEDKTREDAFHPYLSTSGSFSFVQHPVTELSAENNIINNSLDNLEVQEPTAPSSSINRSPVQPRSYERMDDFRSCVEYFSEGIKMLQKRKTLGPLERRLLRESRLQLAQAICDWSMTSSYFSASPQSFAFDGRSRDETRGRLWMRAWKEFYWALMAKPKKMKPRYQTEVDDVITICHTLNLLQSTEGAATTTTTEDTYQSNNEEHEKEPNLAEQEASPSSSSSHHQTRKKKLGSIVAAIMKLEALRNLESIRGRDGLELRCAQWEQHFQQKMKRIESKHIQALHSSLLEHSSKAANDVEKRNEEEKGKRTTRFSDASFDNTKRMHTSGLFAHPHHSLLEAGSRGAKKFKPFSAVRQRLTKRLHHRPQTNSVTPNFIAEVGHKEDNNQDKQIADRWLQQQHHHIQKTSSSFSSSSSSSSSSSVSASSSTASSSATAASSSPSASPPLSCSSFSFIQRERELRRSWEKNIITETNERNDYEKTIRATHDGIPVSVIAQSESEAIKEKEEEDGSADVVVTPKLKRRGTTEFYELMRRGSRLSTGIYDDEDEDDDVEAEEDSDESSYSTTESEDEEETEEEGTSSSDANETSEFSICEELSMEDNVEDTNPSDNVERTEEAEGDRREGKGIDLRKCSIQLQIPKEEKEKEEYKKEPISSPSSSSSSSTRKHFSLHSLRTKIRKRSRSFNTSDANEAMEERQCDAENDEAAKSKSVDALHLSQTTTLILPSAYSSRSSPASGSSVCSSISPRHASSQEIVSTHSKHHPSQQRKFSDPSSLSSSVVNTASTSSPSSLQHSCQYQYQWSGATRSENAVASANNVQQRKGSGTAFERLFGARGIKPKPFTKNLSLGRASWLSWFAAGTGLSNHPTDLALVDGKQVAFGSNYKTFLSSSLRHQSNLSLATNLALDGKNGLAQSVVNVNATTISAAELWEVRRANKRRPRSNSSASKQSPEKQREAVDENRSLVVVQDVHRKYLCYDDEKDQVFTRRDLCCLWEWVVIKEGDCIGLRTYPQGKWLCVSRNHQLYIGARNALRSYERWTVTMVHNIVHLRTLHGGYLYPKGPGPLRLTPNTAVAKSFSRWFMDYQNDGSVTLRSYSDGRYLAYNHSDHNKQTLTYAAQPYPWFLKTYNNVDKVVSLYTVVPSSSYDNELAEGDHQKTTRMYLGYRYRSPSPKDNNSRATFVMASWNNVVAQEKTWQQQQRSWKMKKKLQQQQQQQKEKETEKEKEKEIEHDERREDKTDREPETEQTKENEEEEEVERIGVAWVMERPDSSLTEKLTELYAELELIDGWNTVEKLRSGVFLLDMSI